MFNSCKKINQFICYRLNISIINSKEQGQTKMQMCAVMNYH